MGGQNETVLKSETIKGIRVHTNNGEIHFHDDKQKLKVAIPLAEWYNGLARLRSDHSHGFQENRWKYVDIKNKTALNITLRFSNGRDSELYLWISPVIIDSEFEKLLSFSR